MKKIVYFDTNVFDHLINNKNGITKIDEINLRKAVNSGRISIPISLINLEETFCALDNYPAEAEKQFLIISQLGDPSKTTKLPEELIFDDLYSYSLHGEQSNPYSKKSIIGIDLKELKSRKRRAEFKKIIDKIKDEKKEFKLETINARNLVLGKSTIEKNLTFDQFWESMKRHFVRGLVERTELSEQFRFINMNNLINLRSVRLWTGWSISFVYGQLFEKRKPKPSDSRDMKHAVLASVADIFVTHDQDFAELMERIPIENFKVFGHLHDLLDYL